MNMQLQQLRRLITDISHNLVPRAFSLAWDGVGKDPGIGQ